MVPRAVGISTRGQTIKPSMTLLRLLYIVLTIVLYVILLPWGIGDAIDREIKYETSHRQTMGVVESLSEGTR